MESWLFDLVAKHGSAGGSTPIRALPNPVAGLESFFLFLSDMHFCFILWPCIVGVGLLSFSQVSIIESKMLLSSL
jgi:hypothetical protein